MEEKKFIKRPQLSLRSKSQLHFGIKYSNKINDLRIFIYGLRGVNILIKNYIM